MIRFWTYKKEYQKYSHQILNKINITLKKGNIFFGDELNKFEKSFVKKNKSKYGIGVGSGTDALLLSLKALNIKKGDEVITAANTAIPTISAIINSGATPRLVDVNDNFLIDVNKIEREINTKTKVIIPVHLYGQSCDMDKIIKLSKKHNLKIIEDCAQSQGAKYKNRYVGTFGEFGCFSFYPTKILGAYGDGGFIITKNYNYYKKIKRLRFYGIETIDKKNKFINLYYANENGFNSRLDEIQSSILNLKLNKLDKFIKRRKFLANLYIKELKKTNLKLPHEIENNDHVYHLFTVFHKKAKDIIIELNKKKIETRKIYPFPIHKMNVYSRIKRGNLSYTEYLSKGIFCLPLYPELKNKQVKYICKELKKILNKNNW